MKESQRTVNNKNYNFTGEVGETRQVYSRNNNLQGGGIIEEKINTKSKIANKEAEEAEKNRRNGGDSERGYIQTKAILEDGYCWSCGWRTNHKSPQCFRRLKERIVSAPCADTKNGSDKNKGWN